MSDAISNQLNEKDIDQPNIVMLKIEGHFCAVCAQTGNLEINKGDYCLCDLYGEEVFAQVLEPPQKMPFHCSYQTIRRVKRLASQKEVESLRNSAKLEQDATRFCIERIKARDLKMKMIKVKDNLKEHKIVFYYTAESRVDFRELVKDLAARFRTRIEMRQIGVRDEAKLLAGCGVCGRSFCCSAFIENFAPISIRMAKQQNINLNPAKISGICGRLMCCLGYEQNDLQINPKDATDEESAETAAGSNELIEDLSENSNSSSNGN